MRKNRDFLYALRNKTVQVIVLAHTTAGKGTDRKKNIFYIQCKARFFI